jgi:hypothetical protein
VKYRYVIFFFLGFLSASAQSKKIKIVDSLSLDPISFATVFFSNNNGIISNELGFFELVSEQYKIQDTLFVSSMGYETKRIPITAFNDTIIRLKPKTITLKNVVVTNKELSSIEIIEKVKQNIELNYNSGINENKLFFRQDYNQISEEFTLSKLKSSIKDLNAKVMDSILENLPKESRSELESLSYYYANDELDTPKIKLIKSRRTNDDNASDLSKSLGKKLESSLKENLKSSSYFKIRSGWLPFSFDLTINGLWDIDSTDQKQLDKLKQEEVKRKENFSNFQKGRVQNVYLKSFTNSNSDLNFILESKRYQFSNPELSYLGNDLVYVINCLPLRSDKFKATLYINSEDFAVVRLDYENVKPLSKFKLLGISLLEYLEKGRMRFSKLNNEKYDLSYFQSTKENKVSINRPFKIIEKNKVVKGRNKQNQISAKLNLSIKSKYNIELQVFKTRVINSKEFDDLDEKNQVLPEYLEEFTTNFWEEFNE